MPGRTKPGRTSKAAARKQPGDRETGREAAGRSPGGQDEAPGWPEPDWAVPGETVSGQTAPGETVVPDGADMAAAGGWLGGDEADGAAGEWADGEEAAGGTPAAGKSAAGEWFGGEEAARAACLRLLTSAPRTRAQLAAALRRRRVPDEIAESVLARFAEVGLIDDAAFARAWVESRHHSRGLARKALAAELRQRGIADREVRAAVDSLGPQDEMAAARRLVQKRMAATRGRPLPARARQLLGMLARKGYPAGLAAQVVREALELQEAGDPDARMGLALICEDSAGSDWS